ncbi:phytoene/squalene synthase family protein [Pontibacter sp. BT310]|uniref:Phytoene/squalene synthase family protein n=1 Tax=Pontibacter populi TaxID=890055 RepID=A0ABS6XDX6_9BACT|nr:MULTISPECIES: phytoene/squalene synthase family protein [Pontibacter]MBJ6118551.1 phytoene/squalene synthase family protein [Pontibacter sp. BT310]MBR0570980.1 phytoene/squalene synthase family protein [Microvirga sp. STS03]MBW3365405.1 phytoene/squalene synthase family protein [Pontibacter populi]
MDLFKQTCLKCSKVFTEAYSTSFTLGIRTLHQKFHFPIYAIYGFVRCADEIVDTFHEHNKKELLQEFKEQTYKSIATGISLNPVLHAFQCVVNEYKIDLEYIEAFLRSMEMDLEEQQYDHQLYDNYIYGSAEVVGLMCLKVFCEGDDTMFERLKGSACSLGSAFQKVNFLRDMQSDYLDRGRVYFPKVDFKQFDNISKSEIEADICKDFEDAYKGIMELPRTARLGVYLAYKYYLKLFRKIQNLPATHILTERVRVPDNTKLALLVSSYLRYQLNAI